LDLRLIVSWVVLGIVALLLDGSVRDYSVRMSHAIIKKRLFAGEA